MQNSAIFKSRWLFLGLLLFLIAVWGIRLLDVHYNGYDLVYASHGYYNSDDATQANILWDWQHGHKEHAVVGDDNWIIKYPLYILVNNLPTSPLKKLFLTSFVVLVITAILILSALFLFTHELDMSRRKQGLALATATLILATIPAQAFGIVKMPNSRNVEIGIFLLLLFLFYCYEQKQKRFTSHVKLKWAGVFLITGLLYVDDPLFMYMTAPPLLIGAAYLYFTRTIELRKAATLSALVVVPVFLSLIFKRIIFLLLPLSFAPHASTIANIDQVLSTLSYLLGQGAGMLGADILGRAPLASSTLGVVSAIFLLSVAFATVVYEYVRNRRSGFSIYQLALWLWIPLLLSVSSLGVTPGASRYMILIVFLIPLSLIFAVYRLNANRQLYLLLSVAILGFLIMFRATTLALVNTRSRPNTDNYTTIGVIQKLGLRKGYTRFWDAEIDSYLSNHQIMFIPADCNKSTQALDTGTKLFEHAEANEPATRSFYLYVPDQDMISCSPAALTPYLGTPVKLIYTGINGQEIAVYNYDISAKLAENK